MQNNNIVIIEYNPKLAASVATMWNNTKDGWNGRDWSTTTENVLTEESISDYINLFLAVDCQAINDAEPKVVGYCKLTKDLNDENALYIDLLSVLPEYFNKKIGKALVLKSIERTIELNYPKLYLYTWSGNTKSVPLYKKCGFFWKQGDEVHLANMIPSVIKCEAVADFFKTAHWYDDSTRAIEIEPDGRIENKFEYFTYSWEKDSSKLSMEYCQKGKGLRKIDCDDYSITATVCNRDLIFGQKHQISYEIINKSGKPLEIELAGNDDKNIRFNYQDKFSVETIKTITAEFMVDPIEKVQQSKSAHPLVCTTIKINGKPAEFKTGIIPKHPVSVSLKTYSNFNYEADQGQAYVNLENFCHEKCEINFDLSNGSDILFENSEITAVLQPLEKRSIKLNCKINKGCLFKKRVEINLMLENGQTIKFYKEISNGFYTHNSKGFQEIEQYHDASIGKYRIYLRRKNVRCNFYFVDAENNEQNICYLPPQFGKPYSEEFVRNEAHTIISYEEHNAVVLKASYSSQDFPGLDLVIYYRLFTSGILEKWQEITNNSDKILPDEMSYLEKFDWIDFDYGNMFIPYENQLINIPYNANHTLDNYESSKVTENWLFSEKGSQSAGVVWPKEYSIKFMGESPAIEHNLAGLKPGETRITKPVWLALNAFNLESFRKFAAKQNIVETVYPVKSNDIIVNSGNPFVQDHLTIELREYQNQPLNATVKVESKSKYFASQQILAKSEDNLFALKLDFPVNATKPIEEIQCSVRYLSEQFNQIKKIFRVGSEKIKLSQSIEEDKTVFSVDNGVIKFKTSPDFAPTVYSLIYNDREWVDSSFPQTISKSWWTPWFGGLFSGLNGIGEKELIEEDTTVEFVTIADNFKNSWQGVKIMIKNSKKEELEGLSFEQFFLTLTGSPVLVNFVRVQNNSGKFCDHGYYKLPFFKGSSEISNNYLEYLNSNQEFCRFYSGYEHTNKTLDYDSIHSLCSEETVDKLHFFQTKKISQTEFWPNETTTSKVVFDNFKLPDGESFVSGNEFMIFSAEDMDYKEVVDLRNIKFEI